MEIKQRKGQRWKEGSGRRGVQSGFQRGTLELDCKGAFRAVLEEKRLRVLAIKVITRTKAAGERVILSGLTRVQHRE